jgi:hypothetical protein
MESLKNNKNVATSSIDMPTMKTPNKHENADSALSSAACSRWEWVERTFDSREVADHAFVSWIMQHVRMSPFTLKLNLRDGEVVRTTSEQKETSAQRRLIFGKKRTLKTVTKLTDLTD